MASGINQREYHDLNSNLNTIFRSTHYIHKICLFNVTAKHGKEEFYLFFNCQSVQNIFI